MADPNSSGFYSRKMIMAYVAMFTVTGAFAATAYWPSLNVSYADFCMALLTAAGIYTGGNAVSKFITLKHGKTPPKKTEDPPAS